MARSDEEPELEPEDDLKRGGPATCPRPCADCAAEPGEPQGHHWLPYATMPDPDDPDSMASHAEHPAAKAHGLPAWYDCKHCDAWVEDVEDEDEF